MINGNTYINGTLVYTSNTSATTTVTSGASIIGSQETTGQMNIVNSGGAGVGTDANGKIINGTVGQTTASLLVTNGIGDNHGVVVNETGTTLSGGVHSTSLVLDDNGARFSNAQTGAPVKVTGVADGTADFDAVNFRQLQKANIGIASVSALSAIPATMPGKNFAIGAGYGYFEGCSAVAIGVKAAIWNNVSVAAGVGLGVGQSTNTFTTNAGFSYSF